MNRYHSSLFVLLLIVFLFGCNAVKQVIQLSNEATSAYREEDFYAAFQKYETNMFANKPKH